MSADTENGEASAKEDTSREEEEEEEGGEETKDNKTKEDKKEKTSSRKRAAPTEKKEGGRKSVRESKQITPFKPPEPKDYDDGISIPAGKGTPVGEIANCITALARYKNDDAVVGKLHRLMFGVGGKKKDFKQNIRLFKGLAPHEDRAKLLKKTSSSKLEMKDLRPIMHILDLERTDTRDEAIENLVDFLLHPKSSGKTYQAYKDAGSGSSSGSKKKPGKRKSSDKKEGTPRAPSGYMTFVKEKRASVVSKHPEAGFGDIGRLLGKKWNKLSDSEKAEWTEKGRKLGPKSETKEKKKKASSKKSKKEQSSSSEEASDSSEEEEEDEALSDAIRAKIKSIVASGAEELTIRQIKEQLKSDFADEVANKGPEIKIFVHKCVDSQ